MCLLVHACVRTCLLFGLYREMHGVRGDVAVIGRDKLVEG